MDPIKIILIQDDLVSARDLSAKLEGFGFHVLAVYHFAEVPSQIIRGTEPDIALICVQPGEELAGIQAANQISESHHIPVIYILADESEAILAQVKTGQAQGYLVAPYRVSELRSSIEVNCHYHHQMQQMRAQEARFRHISELVSEFGYAFSVNANEDIRIDWLSESFEKISGYSPAEVGEMGWVKIVYPEDEAVLRAHLRLLLMGNEDSCELRMGSKNGGLRWYRVYSRPGWDASQGRVTQIFGAVQNISEQKFVQKVSQQHYQELKLFSRIGQVLTSSLDLAEVLSTVLDETRRLFDITAASIWLLDAAARELVCYRATGASADMVNGWRLSIDTGIVGWVARHAETVLIADASLEAHHYEGVERKTGVVLPSIICTPLIIENEIIGVIQALDKRVGYFSSEQANLFKLLADYAATAIWNARLFDAAQKEIDERQKVEQVLQRSEERFRKLAQLAPIGIYLTDQAGNCQYVNPYWMQITGLNFEQALGNGWVSCLHPEDREFVLKSWNRMVESDDNLGLEYRFHNPEGKITWVNGLATKMFNDQNELVGFLGVAFDITKRKKRDQIWQARFKLVEYAESHALPDLLQLTLDEAEALTGSLIGFYHFLEEDQETLGLQQWSSNTLVSLCQAEARGLHYAVDQAGVWADCIRQRAPVVHNQVEALPHRKGYPEGHAQVTRELVIPVFRGEKIVAILGVGNKPQNYTEEDIETITTLADLAWDIAERKLAEHDIRTNEERYRSLFNSSPLAITVFGNDGVVLDCNESTVEISGFPREQIVGQHFNQIKMFTGNAQAEFTPIFEQSLASGSVVPQNTRFIRPDGEIRWLESTIVPLQENGEIDRVQIISRDITLLMLAEQERRKAFQLLQTTIDGVSEPILVIGLDYQVQLMNQTMRQAGLANGLPISQPITCYQLSHSRETPCRGMQHPCPLLEVKRSMLPVTVTHEHFLKGETRIIEMIASPLIGPDGEMTGIVEAARDITDRKKADQALRENQKLLGLIAENFPNSYLSIIEKDFTVGFTSGQEFTKRNLQPEQFIGLTLEQIFGEYAPLVREHYEKTFQGEERSFELFIDGQFQYYRSVPLHADDGSIARILAVAENITERKLAEALLLERHQKLETLHRISEIGLQGKTLQTTLDEIVKEITRATGFPMVTIELYDPTRQVMQFIAAQGLPRAYLELPLEIPVHQTMSGIVAQSGEPLLETHPGERAEYTYKALRQLNVQTFLCVPMLTKNKVLGTVSLAHRESFTVKQELLAFMGGLANLVATIIERKQAEEQLLVSLHEKELLLKEVHHRVKNNLQIISSLLDLQSDVLDDPAIYQGFMESKNRIYSMALIHEKLYQSGDLAHVDMSGYLHSLYNYLVRNYGSQANNITIEVETDDASVSMDIAIPCGMIVNELVSNAIKYAFPHGESGQIQIAFQRVENEYVLRIADNGVGLPQEIDIHNSSSLGVQLVDLLTQQLKGKLILEREAGTVFNITFPAPN